MVIQDGNQAHDDAVLQRPSRSRRHVLLARLCHSAAGALQVPSFCANTFSKRVNAGPQWTGAGGGL